MGISLPYLLCEAIDIFIVSIILVEVLVTCRYLYAVLALVNIDLPTIHTSILPCWTDPQSSKFRKVRADLGSLHSYPKDSFNTVC